MELTKYSFPQLIVAWTKSRNTVERFNGSASDDKILGMSRSVFYTLLVISLILWIVAIYLLVKHAHEMPEWAVIISILSLFLISGGPIITIVLALMVRKY